MTLPSSVPTCRPTSTDRPARAVWSPYHGWNLRRNPFGELTRAERAELAIVDAMDEWVSMLAVPSTAIQFLGDCGHGKSTRLLALLRAIPSSAYVYFPERGPRPALPAARPLLVDEAQRMGPVRRRALLRSPGGIALGTHVDLSSLLRRAGFEVLTVDLQHPLPAITLARILNRRIAASRLDPTRETIAIDADQASKWLDRFGGNIRTIESYLYDQLQTSISGKSPWPPVT